jgi:type II secretory ATPase GspE/PulE/Tfp pilus assembly ATPase PilB-like protein
MAVSSETLIGAAIESGLIDADTVAELRVKARRERSDLLETITLHGRFPLAALYRALAALKELPFLANRDLRVETELFRRIPPSLLLRRRCLPVRGPGDECFLATADPEDYFAAEQIGRILGQPLALAVAEPLAIEARLRKLLRQSLPDLTEANEAAAEIDPVAELDEIFRQAYVSRASDIHFMPGKAGMTVRFRVDGRLLDHPADYSPDEAASLLSRVKVLSGMDISEQRLPQDGGMSHRVAEGREFDLRVAAMPTRWGERGTLRLLEQDASGLSLTRLGLGDAALARFREAIAKPHGMVLVTGPTGSGKSTTLYAALQEIVSPEINVLTVEDPIERVIDGASQVQVGGKVSFAGALRGFLRHDPDVIMVGEIRDAETTDIAMKAALTGHLVFSTLHTNSAVSAVTRLHDIGAERFLIASTLVAVIAQRLVRRLCFHCKRRRPAEARESAWLGAGEGLELFEPVGCPVCTGTGYRGRIGLFETLWIGEELSRLIAAGGSEGDLTAAAQDYRTLWDDGRDKAMSGVTSLNEVMRAAGRPASASGNLP